MTSLGIAFAALLIGSTAPATVHYSPKPFSTADTLHVTVQTAKAAPSGFAYHVRFASFASSSAAAQDGCARSSSATDMNTVGFAGGHGRTLRTVLQPESLEGDHFCTGPAAIIVFLLNAAGQSRTVASSSLTVLP